MARKVDFHALMIHDLSTDYCKEEKSPDLYISCYTATDLTGFKSHSLTAGYVSSDYCTRVIFSAGSVEIN